MIEMRWLKRVRKDLPPEFNYLSPNAMESVLQYRYPLSVKKIVDLDRVHETVSNWSEWIDVPTVKEE